MTATESIDGGGPLDQDGSATPASDEAPSRGRARWGVFAGLAILVVVLDQLSKAWLVGRLAPDTAMPVIGDLFRLVHGRNSGALFGVFKDRAVLFGIVSLVVVVLILVYHARSGRNVYLSVALGLLLGGAIGNLVDRFRLGYVVDWLDLGLGATRFWTFNLADAAVTTAILLILGLALFPSVAARLGAPVDG